MIDKKKEFIVTNRSASEVFYSVPNLGVNRTIAAGQSIRVVYDELEQLSFVPGGNKLMAEFLMITDPEQPTAVSTEVEPEYYYTDEDVKALLTTGTMDEFLDALDFAPLGVISLIKKYAVELPCNDVAKREALKEKLGIDVGAMIENAKPEEGIQEEKPSGRRVKKNVEEPVKASSPRRTTKTASAPKVSATSR